MLYVNKCKTYFIKFIVQCMHCSVYGKLMYLCWCYVFSITCCNPYSSHCTYIHRYISLNRTQPPFMLNSMLNSLASWNNCYERKDTSTKKRRATNATHAKCAFDIRMKFGLWEYWSCLVIVLPWDSLVVL